MESKLDIIIGILITEANKIADYFQIFFENGTILNIYNEYYFIPNKTFNLSQIKGFKISDVLESKSEVKITFSNKINLIIDLRDDAFKGPEAITLSVPGDPMVVWN